MKWRLLMTIEADVAGPVSAGDPGGGERRYIPITGGHFEGDIAGKVLPGGDWQTVLADGTIELSAHYILETEDGGRLEVISDGVRSGPPEVLERLARGDTVDPALYYFRTAMRFRTGASALARFNRVLAVGLGERGPGRVLITAYEIL